MFKYPQSPCFSKTNVNIHLEMVYYIQPGAPVKEKKGIVFLNKQCVTATFILLENVEQC